MLAVAILAAGKGTRMVSKLPKVLHKLSGETLLERVLNVCKDLNPNKIFIVVGHESSKIIDSLKNHPNLENINFVLQQPQNGTGHAIQVLSKELQSFSGNLLVLNGDVPLITSKTLKELIKLHTSELADATLITTKKNNPHGYGRVFLKDKFVNKIIEEKDCTEKEKSNQIINSGIYCYKWESLFKIINNLRKNNKQNELYLTDTISLLNKCISYYIKSEEEIEGINNRTQLAKCEEIIQERIKYKHMMNGVTFINPATTSVSEESLIGIDVVIEANSHIRGKSVIEDNCVIGPNTFIENSYINKNSKIINSTILKSEIQDNVSIGPYTHIRPDCKISTNSKVGNFVELKQSVIAESVKINHLSYIGDSNVGKLTNIGAGTITANFDGTNKNKTFIGENCSVGANSVLIAPVILENSVTTGAGSVINKNIEKNSLGISRAKQINIKNWKK